MGAGEGGVLSGCSIAVAAAAYERPAKRIELDAPALALTKEVCRQRSGKGFQCRDFPGKGAALMDASGACEGARRRLGIAAGVDLARNSGTK